MSVEPMRSMGAIITDVKSYLRSADEIRAEANVERPRQSLSSRSPRHHGCSSQEIFTGLHRAPHRLVALLYFAGREQSHCTEPCNVGEMGQSGLWQFVVILGNGRKSFRRGGPHSWQKFPCGGYCWGVGGGAAGRRTKSTPFLAFSSTVRWRFSMSARTLFSPP